MKSKEDKTASSISDMNHLVKTMETLVKQMQGNCRPTVTRQIEPEDNSLVTQKDLRVHKAAIQALCERLDDLEERVKSVEEDTSDLEKDLDNGCYSEKEDVAECFRELAEKLGDLADSLEG